MGAPALEDSGRHTESVIEGGVAVLARPNVVRKGRGVEEGAPANEDLQAALRFTDGIGSTFWHFFFTWHAFSANCSFSGCIFRFCCRQRFFLFCFLLLNVPGPSQTPKDHKNHGIVVNSQGFAKSVKATF